MKGAAEMGLTLYKHNEEAYEAALSMLSETGKAAIVHPTGTGKSFIGFKLCEDNPNETVCWLSPSEYIFKTQLENWAKAGGEALENIAFFTYAKLMNMTDADMAEIKPTYFVFDEFHRAGAEKWSEAVERLLALYPNVPMLGLSATNIRYLDNQRNMADELFDGNIASEMTLGEAIVRGILNPPKYILSVFSYQKDLDRYTQKVRSARSKAVRDAGEKYLEALRRALENADGVDVIFDKHMTDRTGKYLVFCSDAEHMREMIQKVPEWFAKIDHAPHVYSAYSDDPETSKAFADFKADESDHLKLLFCIDMLNEGVHVENVSGVILLRPTISPIIYKQQIGRALSTGKSGEPVIFDIVMNINNLYSIGSIQEEMRAAITYYRYTGDYANIVNDTFTLIDEVQDCKKLFDELEDTLSASWDLMYAEAKKYYETYGNLLISVRYKTESGLSLGSWLMNQRYIHNGIHEGHLTERQVQQLEEIGIVWDNYHQTTWERNFEAAKAYFEKFGDLRVPIDYITDDGFRLGIWVQMMRNARSNERTSIATPERIDRLNEIGMVWALISDQWERNYQEAVTYSKEHGNLLVPQSYITGSGIRLGNWITHLRQAKQGKSRGKITEEQIERLNLIGMAWDADEERWQIGLAAAKKYAAENHDLNIPARYVDEDGYNLGLWIQLKRRQYKKGTLTREQVCALEAIGIHWDVFSEQWDAMYTEAQAYYKTHKDLNVPRGYIGSNGKRLDSWIFKQRREKEKLTHEQVKRLEKIGMIWRKQPQTETKETPLYV